MFKLAESLFIQEEIKGELPETMYADIYDKASNCMEKVTSTEDCFVFLYDNKYFIELGYNRNYTESGPEGEFLIIISLATDEKIKHFSEEPVLVEVEIEE